MPARKSGESESSFISRCMGEERMKSEFPDNKQRYAVCQSKLREEKGGKKHESSESKKEARNEGD